MARAIQLGNLLVDPEKGDASVGGQPAHLTFVEFELLLKLAHRAGRLVRREALSSLLSTSQSTERGVSLNVHISRLRKKLQASDRWVIKTVRRRGYMLTDEEPVPEQVFSRAPDRSGEPVLSGRAPGSVTGPRVSRRS